jgi:hypothetical protein
MNDHVESRLTILHVIVLVGDDPRAKPSAKRGVCDRIAYSVVHGVPYLVVVFALQVEHYRIILHLSNRLHRSAAYVRG